MCLREYVDFGTGPLLIEMKRLQFDRAKIDDLRARLSGRETQFGKYQKDSKIGRIVASVASLLILGDVALVP